MWLAHPPADFDHSPHVGPISSSELTPPHHAAVLKRRRPVAYPVRPMFPPKSRWYNSKRMTLLTRARVVSESRPAIMLFIGLAAFINHQRQGVWANNWHLNVLSACFRRALERVTRMTECPACGLCHVVSVSEYNTSPCVFSRSHRF